MAEIISMVNNKAENVSESLTIFEVRGRPARIRAMEAMVEREEGIMSALLAKMVEQGTEARAEARVEQSRHSLGQSIRSSHKLFTQR